MFIQQFFFIVIRQQGIDDIIELAFHDAVELIDAQTDPMVGYTVLRIVVGTDLFRTVACTDLGTADRTLFFLFLLLVIVVDSCTDDP